MESDSSSVGSIEVKEPSSKLTELWKSLKLNIKILALLEVEHQNLKALLEKNQDKQVILEKVLKEANVNNKPPSKIRAISVFAAPYFRDVNRMVAPPNEDTKIIRQGKYVNAYLNRPRRWNQDENKRLLDGVTAFALMSALKPLKIQRDFVKNKLKEDFPDFKKILEKQLAVREEEIKCESEKPLCELLQKVQGKIDWMTISSVNMEGKRSPEECENMWNNFLDFSVNKDAFTKEEDEKIKDLAEDYKQRDWDTIAKKLKTNRTAIQCCERYQTRLSARFTRRFWTPEEDKRLEDLINQYSVDKTIFWDKISHLMEGRTRKQVKDRYERSISQICNRAPWKPEEDALVLACELKYGMHWVKMKEYFPRRSSYAIRERCVNSLREDVKISSWAKEEDKLLIEYIQKFGYGRWSKISANIPGRTDNMCLTRASILRKNTVESESKKGNKINVNDPETFTKILKPVAPTKNCSNRNMKMKSYRENAIETLFKSLKKVVPDFKVEEEKLESIDISLLTSTLLHQISDDLYRTLKKRESADSEQKLWLESVLDSMFQMTRKVIPLPNRKTQVNAIQIAEMSLYKAYLFREFRCKCGDGDTENVTFSDIDFSKTMNTAVSHYIQPPVSEHQFINMAPNMTTIGGMEVVEATENRLEIMAKYVSHSKTYMDYLCKRRNSPLCLQCLYRDQTIHKSAEITPETITSKMKNDFFVVTETMKKAAYVESASTEICKELCSCASLQESQKSVQLLRQRFMALFLWPALLAATDFSKDQDNILCAGQRPDKERKSKVEKGTGNRKKGKIQIKSKGVKDSERSASGPSTSKDNRELDPSKLLAPQSMDSETGKTVRRQKRIFVPEELRRGKRVCTAKKISYKEDRIRC